MSTPLELSRRIESGAYDTTFQKLYARDSETLERQRARYIEALAAFAEHFGTQREVQIYSAPGRTEIGGNHTDHNHGVVMAAAVNLDIIAVTSRSAQPVARVISKGFRGMDAVDLTDLRARESEKGLSAGLVRGVAAGIAAGGGRVGGIDAYTTSDVLRGSGLSSSAAFEVVMGAILNGEYNDGRFSPVEIAKISQQAENAFFGKPSGLMDQTACSVGSAISIDFRDPTAPVVDEVALDLDRHGFCLCITDTKGSHADLMDDYAAIRSEMERVAACFGKSVLREVDEDAFYADIARVRRETGDRAVLRAIHFFADSRRAGELCRAVREDRFADFLQLILDGGHSSFEYNQNAYSIRHPQQQGVSLGVALSQKVLQGRGAWRLQGGGFAGTIQAFVPSELLQTYRSTLESVFGQGACYALNVRNYGALRVTERL